LSRIRAQCLWRGRRGRLPWSLLVRRQQLVEQLIVRRILWRWFLEWFEFFERRQFLRQLFVRREFHVQQF
jgi:hypothetical protein